MSKVILSQKDLKRIFKLRINTQSRISGPDVWFPIRFIKKKWGVDQGDKSWSFDDDMYGRLMIAGCEKGSKTTKHYCVCKIDSLTIHENETVSFRLGNRDFEAMTPTGERNLKTRMQAKGIRDIVIDHLTPMTVTLKDFNFVELRKISDFVKSAKASNKDKESESIKCLGNISVDYDVLSKELTQIINNSHYRLVSARSNSEKGVRFPYRSVYKANDVYIGSILDVSYNGDSFVVCQNLDREDFQLMKKDLFDKFEKVRKLVDVPIDKL